MENNNSTTISQNGKQSQEKSTNAPIKSSLLLKLFEDELKELYYCEKSVSKTIPKMIRNATSPELIVALINHIAGTDIQVNRLEQIFKYIDKKAVTKKCEPMKSLVNEAEEKIKLCEVGVKCDAEIISSAQKIENYEISSYETLCEFAVSLGLKETVTLLEATLNEKKAADKKLSEAVIYSINIEASQQVAEIYKQ